MLTNLELYGELGVDYAPGFEEIQRKVTLIGELSADE